MMKSIDLFCGISSLGLPNTSDNKDNYGYFDYVKDYLLSLGYHVNAINFSSLDHNYTWDLEKTFKYNYSISKIRNIQIKSIDHLRNKNLLFKLVVPKKYQEKLKVLQSEEKIGDIYKKSEDPIFLYSTGINDMFVFMQAGPVELLNKTIRNNMIDQLEDYFEQAIQNIRGNFVFLTELNPSVTIYVLSFYYSKILKVIDTIIKVQDINSRNSTSTKNLIYYIQNEFNKRLAVLCSEFPNTYFIDLYSEKFPCARMDFHPSREGNILIGKKIVQEMNNHYSCKNEGKKL